MFLLLKKFRNIFLFKNNDINTVIYLLFVLVAITALYDYLYMKSEGVNSILTMLYYNIVTASTVGYGDISPKTVEGMIITLIYIPLAISLFAALLSIAGSLIYIGRSKQFHGIKYIDQALDMVIIGGDEEKVNNVISELLAHEKKVAVINDFYETLPYAYKQGNIRWIKGTPFSDSSLELINHKKVGSYIVLCNDIDDDSSDAKTVYTIDKLRTHSNNRIVAEMSLLYSILSDENTHYTLPTKGRLIALEALVPKSMRVIEGLLNNDQSIGQYNTFNAKEMSWEALSKTFISKKQLAIGYYDKKWEFFPSSQTAIPKDSIVKYIALDPQQNGSTAIKQTILLIGSNKRRINYLIENYFLDTRYSASQFQVIIKEDEHYILDQNAMRIDTLVDYLHQLENRYTHVVIMGDSTDNASNSQNLFLWKNIRYKNKDVKIVTEIVGDSYVNALEQQYEDSNNQFISFYKTGLLVQELQDEGIITFIETLADVRVERINAWEEAIRST
jgi:voltage-gated potassium channel